MTLLLHAIAPRDALREPVAGLLGIDVDELTAWTSTWSEPRTVGRADLLRHHEMVMLVHERCEAVLPARFPTWLREAAAAEQLLRQRHAVLSAALANVAGRAELAVTIIPGTAEPVDEADTPGRRYLRARQQAQRGYAVAQAVAEELTAALGEDVIERLVRPGPRGLGASLALLVPREQAFIVKQRLEATPLADDVRILVNGPWPPYSFASLGPVEA
jgi:gas vesicle protein GvpL/GvpF